MAYALESSKRKFHRLLDSISNNESRVSLASKGDANASTASLNMGHFEKRRRLSVSSSSLTEPKPTEARHTTAEDFPPANQATTSTGQHYEKNADHALNKGPLPEANTNDNLLNPLTDTGAQSPIPSGDVRSLARQPLTPDRNSLKNSTHSPRAASSTETPSQSPTLRLLSKTSERISKTRPSSGASQTSADQNPSVSELDEMSILLKFCPHDRSQLLKRIQTFHAFSRTQWAIKPRAINEVEWAKRGWRLVDKELVSCVSCSKQFLVPYEVTQGDLDCFEDGDDSMVLWHKREQKCAESIVSAHYESCPWKGMGCNDKLYSIPLVFAYKEIDRLGQRFRNICKIARQIPHSTSSPYFNDFELLTIVDTLFERPQVSHSEMFDTEVLSRAILLALFGWDYSVSRSDTLRCGLCFRRVGLWLFRPSTATDGNPVPPKIQSLSPQEQHYEHCPWIDPESQSPGREVKVSGLEALKLVVDKLMATKQRQGDHRKLNGESLNIEERSPASLGSSQDQSRVVARSERGSGGEAADNKRLSRLQALKKTFSIKRKKN